MVHNGSSSGRTGFWTSANPSRLPFVNFSLPLYLLRFEHVKMLFLLVVEVNCVHDVLLALLDDLPDGAADHVAGGEGGDGDALAFACDLHMLTP